MSLNVRFRLFRGEKDFSFVDLFVGGFLDVSAALLFYELKWYNCNVELTFEFCR